MKGGRERGRGRGEEGISDWKIELRIICIYGVVSGVSRRIGDPVMCRFGVRY